MKALVVVRTRSEAELLNRALDGQGSKAVVPGDALVAEMFDKVLLLARLEGKAEHEWYVNASLTRIFHRQRNEA